MTVRHCWIFPVSPAPPMLPIRGSCSLPNLLQGTFPFDQLAVIKHNYLHMIDRMSHYFQVKPQVSWQS